MVIGVVVVVKIGVVVVALVAVLKVVVDVLVVMLVVVISVFSTREKESLLAVRVNLVLANLCAANLLR